MNNARGDAPAAPSPRGPPKAAAPVADGGNKGFNVGMLQRVQVCIYWITFYLYIGVFLYYAKFGFDYII